MSISSLTTEQWWVLRDLVFEADSPDHSPDVPEALRDHPVVALVRRYLAERQRSILDDAARIVAVAKPGVDREFAEQHYWSVLDKS